ncbi:HmuY family protein [uncultured Porphyromonas sp.]|uniref:HmuY family protein n=1 Tax=Porphyromonas sp. TaxID=1924944 RepID=UPI00261E0BA8|nr:HmuY family protein [uncultured Porphyromonas sp.]
MKKTILLSLVALMTLLLCASCKSDKDEPKPAPNPTQKEWVTKQITVDASDYTKWVYISFTKGKVVSVSAPETDLSWDLGLHRYDFKTNGGTSGKGKGAAARTTQKDLKADIPAPKDSEWTLDREGMLLMKFGANKEGKHDMKYEKQSANFLLTSEPKGDGKPGYLNKGIISMAGMPPTVTIDPSVFLVRSAAGQIVRIRVLDYQSATKKTGHITLEYAMQADKK